MRIALLTDIHANLEALDACIAAAAASRVDAWVCLGDIVGYGPDPSAVIDRIAGLGARGAVVIQGNHDAAAAAEQAGMSEKARLAIEWTRARLTAEERRYLRELPLDHRDGDRLYVHASANDPAEWHYVDAPSTAGASLAATDARFTFCGHTHQPALYHAHAGRAPTYFRPHADKSVPLPRMRRHVVVVGSVGQPRDRDARACWGLFDTSDSSIVMRRVPYDVDATMRKIKAAGLPEWLADRLALGR